VSDHLPEHLAYIADAVEQGKNIRSQAAKLRTILAAAQAVGKEWPFLVHLTGTKVEKYCFYCREDEEQECAPDCPHRQLKEALADD